MSLGVAYPFSAVACPILPYSRPSPVFSKFDVHKQLLVRFCTVLSIGFVPFAIRTLARIPLSVARPSAPSLEPTVAFDL